MDNNQINSLVDNPIKDSNSTTDTNNVATIQPITPEGVTLNVETPVITETKPELHPELEGKIEDEKTATEQVQSGEDINKDNTVNPINNTTQTKDPENINIINKTTTQSQDHPLETIDRLSILADENEKDFISNVKAAHEHT